MWHDYQKDLGWKACIQYNTTLESKTGRAKNGKIRFANIKKKEIKHGNQKDV